VSEFEHEDLNLFGKLKRKLEIRNSKSETNVKRENSKFETIPKTKLQPTEQATETKKA